MGDTFSDTCSEHEDGFWNSLRHQNDGDGKCKKSKNRPIPHRGEKFSPVKQSSFQSLSKEAVEAS